MTGSSFSRKTSVYLLIKFVASSSKLLLLIFIMSNIFLFLTVILFRLMLFTLMWTIGNDKISWLVRNVMVLYSKSITVLSFLNRSPIIPSCSRAKDSSAMKKLHFRGWKHSLELEIKSELGYFWMVYPRPYSFLLWISQLRCRLRMYKYYYYLV